ncbi:uncharacterized protein TM35_000074940 [Trypanosoma theileri]|uniref:Uncharacterized protein n=1 Tax=Trypanosoma theileri TaxID=67003 RepID=A0A1X0P3R0_9TRYP|nr:uncharacterized protein TM35_000074940 [Trypanosoma theileri]ORC91070.1 hypothetical protein TM35_000074940 [Trypanosoma theileri]
MSFSAREAIAFLQQFVDDHNSPRFYVIPETSPDVTTEKVSFLESCWSSAVQNSNKYPTNSNNNNRNSSTNNSIGIDANLTALGTCGTCSLTDISPRKASVVPCEAPSNVNPSTPSINSDSQEGFFSTAVIPVHPDMSNRSGRNGVAWVVL